jgi:hypothetical protein
MSRSNPNEDINLVNPAKFFLEWKGKEGGFEYWDKTNKKNVDIPLPFTFIPLCTYVTLKGYNQKKDTSFWSNEVKDIQKEKFVVKGKNNGTKALGTYFEGLYKDLKEQLELNKINYVQSLYIACKDEKGALQLANIQIKTSALGPWIEFCKKNKVMEIGVQVKSFTKEKNGSVDFVAPVYTAVKISDETNKAAIALDEELQVYLKAYLENNKSTEASNLPEVKAEAAQESKTPSRANETHKYPDPPEQDITSGLLDDDGSDMPF